MSDIGIGEHSFGYDFLLFQLNDIGFKFESTGMQLLKPLVVQRTHPKECSLPYSKMIDIFG